MHEFDNIVEVIKEEKEHMDLKHGDTDLDPFDYIQMMLVKVMSARNNEQENTFYNHMNALDAVCEAVTLGIKLMEDHGYTRRFKQPNA